MPYPSSIHNTGHTSRLKWSNNNKTRLILSEWSHNSNIKYKSVWSLSLKLCIVIWDIHIAVVQAGIKGIVLEHPTQSKVLWEALWYGVIGTGRGLKRGWSSAVVTGCRLIHQVLRSGQRWLFRRRVRSWFDHAGENCISRISTWWIHMLRTRHYDCRLKRDQVLMNYY